MRILIVDDSIDKISEISELIFEIVPSANIETTGTIHNAISLISENNQFTLAIIDLLLPLRLNAKPQLDGGKILLKEIYRKNDLRIPNYIIGLSQLEEENFDFSNIWNVIKFNRETPLWRTSLKQLINHIIKTKVENLSKEILPTIYVEGLTDKFYLEQTVELFFPTFKNKFTISSQSNAGANWVANQIAIWAMGKKRDKKTNDYIKAIGLFDSDDAGNIAKSNVDKRGMSANEQQCFFLIQLRASYNPNILAFYQSSCKIEIEIESLFPIDILKHADSQEWLEYRSQTFIEPPSKWQQHDETSIDYIKKQGISPDNLVYLKKVKIDKKEKFKKYIEEQKDKKDVFKNFEPLVDDLIKRLNLK